MKKIRCNFCKHKLQEFYSFDCKCGHIFCTTHRLPSEHNCTFDYYKEQKQQLRQKNKKISIEKIQKI